MTQAYDDRPYPRAAARFPELRQSLLGSFDNCSLTTYFEQTYRRGWSTSPQGRGQLFHRFAGECLRTMARQREEQIPVGEALAILAEVLRQDDADRTCPVCKTDKIKLGLDAQTGQRTCGNGHSFNTELVNVPMAEAKDLHWVAVKWAHDNAFDIQNLVDVEQRLRANVRYVNRAAGGTVDRTLTGQIDALFIEGVDRAIVVDWKDMWAVPGEATVSFSGYFQQRFYAWLVFKNYPTVQEVVLREFYVRYSQTREAVVTRADEQEIEDELAALAERFDRAWDEQLRLEEEKGVSDKRWSFVPRPGKHCGYCIRPSACPIPVFGRGEGRIIDAEHAEKVARQLIVGEEITKQARAALRAYADVHGPVAVHDAKGQRALGYQPQTRTERPDLAQIEQLERELGRPPTSAEVAKLYRVRTGTKFKAFSPVEVNEADTDAEIQEQLRASIAAARARLTTDRGGNVVELRPRRRPDSPSGVRPRVAEPDQP